MIRASVRPGLVGIGVALLSGVAGAQNLVPASPWGGYQGHVVVRVATPTPVALAQTLSLTTNVWSCGGPGLGVWDAQMSPAQFDAFDDLGIPFRVYVADVQGLLDQHWRDVNERAMRDDITWYENYHRLSEIRQYAQTLATENAALVKFADIGKSLEGRDIFSLRITGPGDASARPQIAITGCQHAREWASPTTVMWIAEQLVEQYAKDSRIKYLVDRIEFVIVPIVNPDGYEYSWTTNRMWRKNRRGGYGVDLNRNWGYQWGGEGSSGNTSSETYRGSGPFSEPETQVVSAFIRDNPRVRAHIDYHTYSQLILSPWGYTADLPPDHPRFMRIGAAVADAIRGVHGMRYVYGAAYGTLYPAAGIAPDWSYGDRGALAWTIELRDTGQFGFLLPPEQIIPTGQENWAGFLQVAEEIALPIRIGLPDGAPGRVDPATPTPIRVSITDNASQYVAGSGRLAARIDGGSFVETSLTDLGNGLYRGTLPAAPCGSTIEFYVSARAASGETVFHPAGGPDSPIAVSVLSLRVYADMNFETSPGWTVQNQNLTDGAWERGVPVGGGARGDPPTDYDGSGQCWLTANRTGNSDVDGGPTRLISAPFDLSGATDPILSYARWFYNDDRDQDRLDVDISSDGGSTWVRIESVPHVDGWVVAAARIRDFVPLTSAIVLRFSATDNPNNSLTEAALDRLRIEETYCDQPPPCYADCDKNSRLDIRDFFCFQAAFAARDPYADCDGNTLFDIRDFFCFQARYAGGCP